MGKRFLALLMCIVLALMLLPTVAFAQNAASVWIAGVELTSAAPFYYNDGTVSATDSGYNAYYNTATGILSLNGLIVTDSTATKTLSINGGNTTFDYAICSNGDMTINLISGSVISTASTANGNENIALGVNGDLTITGSGSLTATAGGANGYSAGVDVVGTLTAPEGTLTGNGGVASGSGDGFSVGIYVQNHLTVSGGEVNGNGGQATGTNTGFSNGIYVQKDCSISGGSVSGSGGVAGSTVTPYAESTGIDVVTLTVLGGTAVGTGSAAAGSDYGYSTGIIATDTIATSGSGSLFGNGGTASTYSHGVYSKTGDVEFSGKHVTAIGGEAAVQSYGICADSSSAMIRVTSGNFTAKTTSTASATKAALNKTLTQGSDITAQGSLSSDGSNPISYSDADYSNYVWVSAFNRSTLTVAMNPANGVHAGQTVTLTATPNDIVEPTYQWYSNAENNTINASLISGAVASTYTPPTASAGTVYYYCVANGSTISNIVGVTVLPPADTVTMPTFSPVGGTYTSAQSVTLSCPTPGATIRYTTNGTEPTESSPVFVPEISIPVPSTMTIKAKAFKDGMTTSETASATYTITQPTTGRSISVLPSANGSVTSDKQSARNGETVTLTVTPKEGYQLKTLLILDAFGNDCVQEGFITISDNKFVMPDMALTVQATFEKINADGLTDELASMGGTIHFEYEIPDDCILDIRPGTLPDSFTTKEGETARLFEISVFRNDQLYPINENNMSVTIALTEDLLGFDYYRISYLNNENQLVETQHVTINGAYLQFTTNHLSDYIVEAGNHPSHTHDFISEWNSDGTNHWHECACGEKSDTAAHAYGEWTITKDATATEQGNKERTCSVCGYKETAVIVATGISPQTGDTSDAVLWFVLLLISGGTMTTLGTVNRKRRKHNEH